MLSTRYSRRRTNGATSHFMAPVVRLLEKKERQPPARYSHGYLFETAYAGGLQRLFEKCRFLYRGKFDSIAEGLFSRLKEKCAWYSSRAEAERAYFEEVGRKKSADNAEELLTALASLLTAPDYFAACAQPCPAFSAKERLKKDDTPAIRRPRCGACRRQG